MATLSTTARGAVSASARTRAGTIALQFGASTFLSLVPTEARELAEALLHSATAIEDSATGAAAIEGRQPCAHRHAGGAA